ncbi:hypothetical protein BC940DRAFT_362332, partial [Gongronella butleri]
RRFENVRLDADHNEVWYGGNIWAFLDRAFDDMDVELVSETILKATDIRKNADRDSGTQRKKFGRHMDVVLRTNHADNTAQLEFGVGECGAAARTKRQLTQSTSKRHLSRSQRA